MLGCRINASTQAIGAVRASAGVLSNYCLGCAVNEMLHLRSLGVAWMGAAMWQGMMRWKSQELAMSSTQSATASGTCRRTASLQRQSPVPNALAVKHGHSHSKGAAAAAQPPWSCGG